MMSTTDFTATELANKMLDGFGLTQWQKGYLGLALTELAAHGMKVIRTEDLILELTQMNSQSRHNVVEVVYALTGVGFECIWRMAGELPTFELAAAVMTFPCGTRHDFDSLHIEHGWGSSAHIRALDELIATAFAAHVA